MQAEIYADGVGEITVTGHMVRIDLVSLSATKRDANNKPVTEFRQRIIMPVDAFANTAELMKNVLNGLIQAGAVKLQAPPAQGAGAPAADAARRNGSPNFS
jgi:hypothetical protein